MKNITKSIKIFLSVVFLFSMLSGTISTAAVDHSSLYYEMILTDASGNQITNLQRLNTGDTVNLQIDLTRIDVPASYDIWGIEFQVMSNGLSYGEDGVSFREGTEINKAAYSDGLYVGFAYLDMERQGVTVSNPVTVCKWSYTVNDPSAVNLSVKTAIVYITGNQESIRPENRSEEIHADDVNLTLDANGGTISGTDISGSYIVGQKVTLPAAVRSGYRFNGWSDGSNIYQNGEYTISSNVTLTAQWVFISSGGGGGGSSSGSNSGGGNTLTIPVSSETGNLRIQARVSNSTANIAEIQDSQLQTIIQSDAPKEDIIFDLSSQGSELKTIVLSTNSFQKIANALVMRNKDDTVSFYLASASVTLDSEAVRAIAEQLSNNKSLSLTIDECGVNALTTEQRNALIDLNIIDVFDIYFSEDGKRIGNLEDGHAFISFPLSSTVEEYAVYYIPESGAAEKLEVAYSTDSNSRRVAIATVHHFSFYALAHDMSEKAEENVLTFTDVTEDDYYYNAVLWAVENGVTKGRTDTTFDPNGECTRAHAVTFLWRSCGSPEPVSNQNPFTDVTADSYYYKAVLWAVENGITKGRTDTVFDPSGKCTRAHAVTFLWRFSASPEPVSEQNPFADVAIDKYYYKAVLWAVENGITNGRTDTTFNPNDICTRAHAVTFLSRLLSA